MADSSGNESLASGNGSEVLVLTNASLMEEVQRYVCLNNKQSKEFSDKYKIIKCLETITKMFNSIAHEVEAKFNNIRNAYGRHHKKLKSTAFGSGMKDVPPLNEFKYMKWLSNYSQTSSNFKADSAKAVSMLTVKNKILEVRYDTALVQQSQD